MADRDIVIGRVINVTGMIGVLAELVCSLLGLCCSYFGADSALISPAHFTGFGSRFFILLSRMSTTRPLSGGDLNRSTQHLLILPDEEVCAWMHGPGSRRSRRLSSGSAGRAVNV